MEKANSGDESGGKSSAEATAPRVDRSHVPDSISDAVAVTTAKVWATTTPPTPTFKVVAPTDASKVGKKAAASTTESDPKTAEEYKTTNVWTAAPSSSAANGPAATYATAYPPYYSPYAYPPLATMPAWTYPPPPPPPPTVTDMAVILKKGMLTLAAVSDIANLLPKVDKAGDSSRWRPYYLRLVQMRCKKSGYPEEFPRELLEVADMTLTQVHLQGWIDQQKWMFHRFIAHYCKGGYINTGGTLSSTSLLQSMYKIELLRLAGVEFDPPMPTLTGLLPPMAYYPPPVMVVPPPPGAPPTAAPCVPPAPPPPGMAPPNAAPGVRAYTAMAPPTGASAVPAYTVATMTPKKALSLATSLEIGMVQEEEALASKEWNKCYNAAREHRDLHGHLDDVEDKFLNNWIRKQRMRMKKDLDREKEAEKNDALTVKKRFLKDEERRRLEDLGIMTLRKPRTSSKRGIEQGDQGNSKRPKEIWGRPNVNLITDWVERVYSQDENFDAYYHEMKLYHAEHGHSLPIQKTHQRLYLWAQKLRAEWHLIKTTGKYSMILTPERIARLQKVDFVFEYRKTSTFMERFEEWVAFKTKHGKDPPLGTPGLGKWVSNTRQRYHNAKEGRTPSIKDIRPLNDEELELLHEHGFNFGRRTSESRRRAILLEKARAKQADHGNAGMAGNTLRKSIEAAVEGGTSPQQPNDKALGDASGHSASVGAEKDSVGNSNSAPVGEDDKLDDDDAADAGDEEMSDGSFHETYQEPPTTNDGTALAAAAAAWPGSRDNIQQTAGFYPPPHWPEAVGRRWL